jgi:hypothetical protein
MRRMIGTSATVCFLVVALLCSSGGRAKADANDWLIGHWDGHDTKPADKRSFAMDILSVKADHGFVAQWSINGNVTGRGTGKVDDNAVTISFPNGNTFDLFRASDGSLAGSNATKDGSIGPTLVFIKGVSGKAAAAPASGSGKGCDYHPPAKHGVGATLHANDGEEVIARLGQFKCVDGRLMREN